MQAIDKDKFLFLYTNTYAGAAGLNDSQRQGISALLGFLADDSHVADIRWAAYMLATVKHECAGTWQPIAENGKGQGHSYGDPDPTTGQTYYGRGYVQLTWLQNYRQMGKVLGIDLLNNPDRAMEPQIAYGIMSYGMRTGAFTGVGLPRYIGEGKCDYLDARKIINGLDCADKIAGYASTIEGLLKESI